MAAHSFYFITADKIHVFDQINLPNYMVGTESTVINKYLSYDSLV